MNPNADNDDDFDFIDFHTLNFQFLAACSNENNNWKLIHLLISWSLNALITLIWAIRVEHPATYPALSTH